MEPRINGIRLYKFLFAFFTYVCPWDWSILLYVTLSVHCHFYKTSQYMTLPKSIHLFYYWWSLGCFHFADIMNNVALNSPVHASRCVFAGVPLQPGYSKWSSSTDVTGKLSEMQTLKPQTYCIRIYRFTRSLGHSCAHWSGWTCWDNSYVYLQLNEKPWNAFPK